MQKPNIFRIATRELSHDAVMTWLLQWSDPSHKEKDSDLHDCGTCFLSLFLNNEEREKKVIAVEAERQWMHIDINACVHFEDGDKLFIIIENKIFTEEHSNQLTRYREISSDWAEKNGYRLSCFYTRIGSQAKRFTREIEKKGYNVIDRPKIINCLNGWQGANTVVQDYIDFLQGISDAHNLFKTKSMGTWDGWQWVGFFQSIEIQMEILQWHYVNNRSGGFWNLALNWRSWHSVPIYMQLEEDKLCFKISFEEEDTGFISTKTNINKIQDFVHLRLIEFAITNGFPQIRRPYRLVHSGIYRTIAVVSRIDWLGDGTQLVNNEKVMENLTSFLSFFDKFVESINQTTFEAANILVEYQPDEEVQQV